MHKKIDEKKRKKKCWCFCLLLQTKIKLDSHVQMTLSKYHWIIENGVCFLFSFCRWKWSFRKAINHKTIISFDFGFLLNIFFSRFLLIMIFGGIYSCECWEIVCACVCVCGNGDNFIKGLLWHISDKQTPNKIFMICFKFQVNRLSLG